MKLFNRKKFASALVENAEASAIDVDAEQKRASLVNKINFTLFSIIAVGFVAFQLYTAGTRALTGYKQRLLHLTLALMMSYLVCPPYKKKGEKNKAGGGILGIPCCLFVGFAGFYLFFDYLRLVEKLGRNTPMQYFCGTVIVIAVLDCTRRLIGWPLTLIASCALVYGLFGKYIPGSLGHSGVNLRRTLSTLTMHTEGIMSNPLGASATVVAAFVIFAAFLNQLGIGEYFVDLVMAKFGKSRGASAKTAVMGSALMGMLSGSVIANVVGTGTFTIPMMKKNGYTPTVAGAVEAVSSTGGQIMPPVMGAAAYIIAEMLAIPFQAVILAAIVPALLYYLAELVFVHYEACRLNLAPFGDEEVALYKQRVRGKHYLVTPLLVLVALMILNQHWTAEKCCFWAIVATIGLGVLIRDPKHHLTLKSVFTAVKNGASACLECALATACAGIIIGVFSITGMGVKLSSLLISLSGGHLIILLLLTGLCSLVLGMGLTTTGCYIILATLVAPALVEMGVPKLNAHLFVFMFGIYSAITPPVAVGAYAASSLADADPFKTGYTAFRIALPSFIVPFVIVFSPAIILNGPFLEVIQVCAAAAIGVFFMSLGTVGYFKTVLPLWQRAAFLIAGLCLISPDTITDVVGIVLGGAMMALQFMAARKQSPVAVVEQT